MPTTDDVLILWTIFNRPDDFPRHIVVRRFFVLYGFRDPAPSAIACLYDSLAEARADCEANGCGGYFPRQREDDPTIIESWL